MKPATMPDRKENPRSCSLRSSCKPSIHCRSSCLGFWCCGRSQGHTLYSACKEASREPQGTGGCEARPQLTAPPETELGQLKMHTLGHGRSPLTSSLTGCDHTTIQILWSTYCTEAHVESFGAVQAGVLTTESF